MATQAGTVEVVMPAMGDSVAEGTVLEWRKNEGDQVNAEEPLVEISTDKVDAENGDGAAPSAPSAPTDAEAPAPTDAPEEPADTSPTAVEPPAQLRTVD